MLRDTRMLQNDGKNTLLPLALACLGVQILRGTCERIPIQGRSSLINIGKANFRVELRDLVCRVIVRMHVNGKGACPRKILVRRTPVRQTRCDAYAIVRTKRAEAVDSRCGLHA